MKTLRMLGLAGLMGGLLTASAALAQGGPSPAAGASAGLRPAAPGAPAEPALGVTPSMRLVANIDNETAFSVFTETLGAGQHCLQAAIPATSVPGQASQALGLMRGSGCTAQGLQTFVLGVAGAEQRINVPFQFSGQAAQLGSGSNDVFSVTGTVGRADDGHFVGDWDVRCVWQGCPASAPQLTVQNLGAQDVMINLRHGQQACTGVQPVGYMQVPARQSVSLPVAPCPLFAYDVNNGGAFFISVSGGRYRVDVAPGGGLPLALREDGAGQMTVVVGAPAAARP